MEAASIEEFLTTSDKTMSRTSKLGVVDTSASDLKAVASISPDILLATIKQNRAHAARYIAARYSSACSCKDELVASILALSEIINTGTGVNRVYRNWTLAGRSYGAGINSIEPTSVVETL